MIRANPIQYYILQCINNYRGIISDIMIIDIIMLLQLPVAAIILIYKWNARLNRCQSMNEDTLNKLREVFSR